MSSEDNIQSRKSGSLVAGEKEIQYCQKAKIRISMDCMAICPWLFCSVMVQ